MPVCAGVGSDNKDDSPKTVTPVATPTHRLFLGDLRSAPASSTAIGDHAAIDGVRTPRIGSGTPSRPRGFEPTTIAALGGDARWQINGHRVSPLFPCHRKTMILTGKPLI